MALSGKYDFAGIKKAGRLGFKAALAYSPATSWLLKGGVFTDKILDFITNWLANKGLVIINLGAIYVSGEIDQTKFDSAMDTALEKVKVPGLTDKQKEQIDAKVIEALRKFARINSKP